MARTVGSLVITLEQLKSELPITFVMDHYGHRVARKSAGRLHYHSPFREDTDPSFDVFMSADGVQRWGDFADSDQDAFSSQGSVIDLVGRFEGTDQLKRIMPVARAIYDEFLATDWDESLEPGERLAELDPAILETDRELPIVSSTGSPVVAALMAGRPGVTLEAMQAFEVREGPGYLAAIYPDERAVRIRDSHNEKWFRPGSKTSLYHPAGLGPEDRPSWPVLLTEGESDAWAAWAAYHEDSILVAGLPGTGQVSERFMSALMGRQIVLGFDGDDSGRTFSRFWAAQLKQVGGCSVSILPVSEGRDLASYSIGALQDLMRRRRQAVVNVTDLRALRDGYAIVSSDGDKEDLVSNWCLKVVEVLLGEDDHSYVCEVTTGEGKVDGTYVLAPKDLDSSASLSRWCRQFHGAWWGRTVSVQKLVAELEEQAVYVPTTRTVSRPMLVEPGGFALPGLSLATDVKMVPTGRVQGVATDPWPSSTRQVSAKLVTRLRRTHDRAVMDPILAWMAIAPLRSKYQQFPPLFVTGAAGSGKTTLVELALRKMVNVNDSSALTSTTPYAVSVQMGSTNCLPRWFDEYRPGGRRASIEIVDQSIRDAYNATPSLRGGMTDDKTQIAALGTDAPLVVSGEDLADEQSHRDRLIRVVVPIRGKGKLPRHRSDDAFYAVEYFRWLTVRGEGGSPSPASKPPKVDSEPYIDMGLNERQAWNLGILDAGWYLLSEFVHLLSEGEVELGKPDWSGILEMAQGDSGDRIVEFLQEMYERWGTTNKALWYHPGHDVTYISPAQVVQRAKEDRIELPFTSSRSLLSHLTVNLDGRRVNPRSGPTGGAQRIRYVEVPGNLLEGSD